MYSKKKLCEMTIDELYKEKKMLDDAIPSTKNTKHLLITIAFVVITISLALYAMKDEFSFILTAVIIYMIYFLVNKIIRGNQLIKEIKSRGK